MPIRHPQVLAVEVFNDASVAVGLLATLNDDEVVTDSSWRCSAVFSEHWTSVDFDDAAWQAATEIGKMNEGRFSNYSVHVLSFCFCTYIIYACRVQLKVEKGQ